MNRSARVRKPIRVSRECEGEGYLYPPKKYMEEAGPWLKSSQKSQKVGLVFHGLRADKHCYGWNKQAARVTLLNGIVCGVPRCGERAILRNECTP